MQNDVSTLDIEITANTAHVDANIFFKKTSLDIFTLGCEQQKISGPKLYIPGCWYCVRLLRYVLIFPKF